MSDRPSSGPSFPASPGPDFIREAVAADLASGRFSYVRTRLPPEPNGWMHIGHAKAFSIDYYVAADDVPGEDAGAGFVDEAMFGSACFYKYFSLDWDQLVRNLTPSDLDEATAEDRSTKLELRRGLGKLSKRLREFSVQSNFTFVDSQVSIRPEDQGILTSLSRPLAGQSRYIVNFITEWTRPKARSQARFYVNSVSRRLSQVGAIGLPDIYQERNVFLDFVYQYAFSESGRTVLKFSAENLGDNTYRWTQANLPAREYQMGRTYSVGLTVALFK